MRERVGGEPGRNPFAALWGLDPEVAYLNHGSFGACPTALLEHQSTLRTRLEREAVDFMIRDMGGMTSRVREALGKFTGADPDGLVFIPNATTAVNASLRSWALDPGDEILTTDHTYGACRKTAEFVASRRGAKVVVARVPFPIDEPGQVIERVLAAVTPRTRVALIDHVTSPTALIFPIQDLVDALKERGVEAIVDGAHALGMVPLELDRLGAACYTANAHKWLCAPKGAAFLYVRNDLRDRIRPLVVSHAYDPAGGGLRYREEWDWTGTDDPTPWLSIPECLAYLGGLVPGGWPGLMRRNHDLALKAREILMDAFGAKAPCPPEMIGSMATLPLPTAAEGSPVARLDQDALATWTRARGVESWFCPWKTAPGGKLVRVSAQLYNDDGQYRRLAALLGEALRAG